MSACLKFHFDIFSVDFLSKDNLHWSSQSLRWCQSYESNHSLVLAASLDLIKSPIEFSPDEDLQALERWDKSGFKVSVVKDQSQPAFENPWWGEVKVVADNGIKWITSG